MVAFEIMLTLESLGCFLLFVGSLLNTLHYVFILNQVTLDYFRFPGFCSIKCYMTGTNCTQRTLLTIMGSVGFLPRCPSFHWTKYHAANFFQSHPELHPDKYFCFESIRHWNPFIYCCIGYTIVYRNMPHVATGSQRLMGVVVCQQR